MNAHPQHGNESAAGPAPRISDVHFTSYHAPDAGGLLGFIAVTFADALRIDGIALRRSAPGNIILSFPERRDGSGRRHPIVRPLNAECRAAIEAQILSLLGLETATSGAAITPREAQAGGAP